MVAFTLTIVVAEGVLEATSVTRGVDAPAGTSVMITMTEGWEGAVDLYARHFFSLVNLFLQQSCNSERQCREYDSDTCYHGHCMTLFCEYVRSFSSEVFTCLLATPMIVREVTTATYFLTEEWKGGPAIAPKEAEECRGIPPFFLRINQILFFFFSSAYLSRFLTYFRNILPENLC